MEQRPADTSDEPGSRQSPAAPDGAAPSPRCRAKFLNPLPLVAAEKGAKPTDTAENVPRMDSALGVLTGLRNINLRRIGNSPSLLPTPYSLLPTPYSLLPTPYSLLPTPYCLLPTAYCLLPTAFSVSQKKGIVRIKMTPAER